MAGAALGSAQETVLEVWGRIYAMVWGIRHGRGQAPGRPSWCSPNFSAQQGSCWWQWRTVRPVTLSSELSEPGVPGPASWPAGRALELWIAAARRRRAVLTAIALLTASTWIRLAAAGVSGPEPYAVPLYVVPLGAVALVLGHLHRRRLPATGSWQAYGPVLGLALLPSLGAVFVDVHWLRPLLLALAGLGVTLCGARRRLRAPLLLGGAVLVIDALHELAPAIVQCLGLPPGWAPVAAAGLLLLVVGAAYERRLAESRRLRGRLRHLT